MQAVGEMLRNVSVDLAREFDDVALPAALAHALRPKRTVMTTMEKILWRHGAVRAVVLAGPGVLRDPLGLGVRRFAERANVPVANTWGAKGVLDWRSPHHMGTCGLQADDFELLGFADYELIVATGIDPAESPETRFGLAPVVYLAPSVLAKMTDVPRLHEEIPGNALFERLAAVAQPGYTNESFPRHPARAVMDLKRSLDPDTIVVGQPGPAGLWLARTFPTDLPGTVCVPAIARPGIAAALALLASRNGRRAVAVTTDPPDEITAAVMELAPDLRAEVWGDDVDWTRTEELIDAAGPVVAWT